MGIVVLISANSEWRETLAYYQPLEVQPTPFGGSFVQQVGRQRLRFVQGGWGKISAAASTQFALDTFQPHTIINLGTCGGFAGSIQRDEIILVNETRVYDIMEQMGDPQAALDFYSTHLELSWLPEPYPQEVREGLLISADRDILAEQIAELIEKHQACAADWESGAIAWVAARSGVRCLILRGVTDLVGTDGGEAYDMLEVYHTGTKRVMKLLLDALPGWIAGLAWGKLDPPD